MLHELARAGYARARPLFASLAKHQPACTAVLAGGYPGRVFVDDPERPRTALLVATMSDNSLWCLLAGDPVNDAFNGALSGALSTGTIAGEGVDMLFLICDPEDWGGRLPAVTAPLAPFPVQRRHYVCRQAAGDPEAHLPAGYRLAQMDPAWLDRPDLQLPDNVRWTLERWRSLGQGEAGPPLRDFGFAALAGEGVVAWTTVDFVAGGRGEAGVFTLPSHRRRGLAVATAAAAIGHGLAHGLSQVDWSCAEENAGSIRTAEKLGCRRERDYGQYFLLLDEATNLAYGAYERLEAGDYPGAAALHDRSFAMGTPLPAWAYFDAARVRAGLGDGDGALAGLQQAAAQGWTDVAAVAACHEFAPLHGTAGWAAVLAAMGEDPKGLEDP
jgi:RimJ/RimL family protein N-acetyltransferase